MALYRQIASRVPESVRQAIHFFRPSQIQRRRSNAYLISPNVRLKNIHKGERCFILATGPSVALQDLRPLKNEVCIAVGNFIAHEEYSTIQPQYYCVAPYHHPISEAGWQAWMRQLDAETGSATTFIFGLEDLERNTSEGRFKKHELYWLNFGGSWKQLSGSGVDLTRSIPHPQSVTSMALTVAIYMGFRNIYLLGCDHDWILHLGQSKHFYPEDAHALQRIGYNEWFHTDLEGYFTDYVNLWRQYKVLRHVAARDSIEIVNATQGGLLDVFSRFTLEEILEGPRES